MMDSEILYLVFATTAIIVSTASAQSKSTCQACNCQFNNVEVLSQLIELKIASGELATTVKLQYSIYMQENNANF